MRPAGADSSPLPLHAPLHAPPRVTLYASRHCPACRRLSDELVACCRRGGIEADVRDVLEHLETAARLGITRPPAVLLDGRLFGQGGAVLAKLQRTLST